MKSFSKIFGVSTNLESIRLMYKPSIVKVLFIGESPPASGKFFYKADSPLYQYTQRAFTEIFGEVVGSGEDFLRFFKERGCYLEDLCLTPINHMNKIDRNYYRQQSVGSLTNRLRNAPPQAIIVVMKEIKKCVNKAIQESGLYEERVEVIPFPAQSHHLRYVEELSVILKSLQEDGILV